MGFSYYRRTIFRATLDGILGATAETLSTLRAKTWLLKTYFNYLVIFCEGDSGEIGKQKS